MARFLVFLLLGAITALLWLAYDFASSHRLFGVGIVANALHIAAAAATATLVVAVIAQLTLRYGVEWVLHTKPTNLQRRLVVAVLSFAAVAAVLAHFGVDFSSILVFSALTTAIIGLGIQPTLSSLFAGLAVDRAVRVGDGLLLNGEAVEITSLNWRSVVGRKADGATIVLPNARLTDNTLEVLAPDRPVRSEVKFDVSMAIAPHRLQKLVSDLIGDMPEVDPSQPIVAMPLNLEAGAYRATFSVRHFSQRASAEGRVLRRLWYVLRRESPVALSEAATQDLLQKMRATLPSIPAEAAVQAGESLIYDDGERIALPDRLAGHVCLLVDGALAEALPGRASTHASHGLTREASLGRIKRLLAERIGPYAEYAVDQAAAAGADIATVCRDVSQEIDDPGERARFLDDRKSAAGTDPPSGPDVPHTARPRSAPPLGATVQGRRPRADPGGTRSGVQRQIAPRGRSRGQLQRLPQIFHQEGIGCLPRLLVGHPQDRRGVGRHHAAQAFSHLHQPSALARQNDLAAHKRLCGGDSQRQDEMRADQGNLLVDPDATHLDLITIGPLVQALLAARLVLEMLHRVGEIDRCPIDAGVGQRAIEQAAGWPDEGTAGDILLITGLLAHHHERGAGRSFAEHGLGGVAIERAAPARRRLAGDACQLRG